MRKAGREAFRHSLSYTRGDGLVDALLREVTARLEVDTPTQSHPNTALQRVPETRPLDAAQPNIAALQHVMNTRNGPSSGAKCDQCGRRTTEGSVGAQWVQWSRSRNRPPALAPSAPPAS